VFEGATAFAAPMTEQDRVVGVTGSPLQQPLVWFSAPVRGAAGEIIGALNIGKFAEERFAAVFLAARLGETGEAYAFDLHGRMLTKSRFRAELEESGRIAAGHSEVLNLALIDPASEESERVFTRLVQQAIASRSDEGGNVHGEVTLPYSNYVGHSVVGAWRWVPRFGFGIAVEVGEAEAFAPLKRLERAFLAILVAAAAALLFLLVALVRIVRLRRERDEAQRIGNYELLEQVGQGGMARVYRARHRLLKRPTAVKIIELAVATDEMLARFDREVRLASQLMHPNTVEVFDYGRTPDGQPFYAMEFLDGLTLQQIVEQHGPLPAPRVAHVLRGIAGSLSEAHELGLVHRDIKPANVMLCRRGGEFDVVKVLDFGLVKDTRTQPTRDLTRALKVLGTPAYMAPERIERAESADPRSDLYALGAVGFYMLTGRPPFAADNDLGIAYQVVHTTPPDVSVLPNVQVPVELARLVNACLAKDPAQRPRTAVEMIEALDRLLLATSWTPATARAWWEARDAVRAGSPQPVAA
jgi:serine/threonine-protein kinase